MLRKITPFDRQVWLCWTIIGLGSQKPPLVRSCRTKAKPATVFQRSINLTLFQDVGCDTKQQTDKLILRHIWPLFTKYLWCLVVEQTLNRLKQNIKHLACRVGPSLACQQWYVLPTMLPIRQRWSHNRLLSGSIFTFYSGTWND